MPQEDGGINGESLLETSLVKDKFGNTLNLIDASDSCLHKRRDETTSQSDRSVTGGCIRDPFIDIIIMSHFGINYLID